jgi:hypothetical protein
MKDAFCSAALIVAALLAVTRQRPRKSWPR